MEISCIYEIDSVVILLTLVSQSNIILINGGVNK